MSRPALIVSVALLSATAAAAEPVPLTLEQIMANPDWIAGHIELPPAFEPSAGSRPYFSADSQGV